LACEEPGAAFLGPNGTRNARCQTVVRFVIMAVFVCPLIELKGGRGDRCGIINFCVTVKAQKYRYSVPYTVNTKVHQCLYKNSHPLVAKLMEDSATLVVTPEIVFLLFTCFSVLVFFPFLN
jgi:hypothetical protein